MFMRAFDFHYDSSLRFHFIAQTVEFRIRHISLVAIQSFGSILIKRPNTTIR